MQRAYDELERDGVVYSKRRVGLFVAERGVKSARDRAVERMRTAIEEAEAAGCAAELLAEQMRAVFEAVSHGDSQTGRQRS